MFLFKKVKHLQEYFKLVKENKESLTIGFVPTMGALHLGHLSLIERSLSENDYTVCSIFVNPTQFNDVSDLEKYPRTIKKDMQLLEAAGNDILFWPKVSEVYPSGLDTKLNISFGQLETVMEGYFRPGHFDGMAQVVKRLLDMVQPDRLYMGQKDFQQFAIVQNMIIQLALPVELKMCAIIREEDGLAMSSRNVRLKPELRTQAPLINKTLEAVAQKIRKGQKPATVKAWAVRQLTIPDFRPEYFEIVDGRTLQPIINMKTSNYVVACTAVWVGDIRLIDNKVLMFAPS